MISSEYLAIIAIFLTGLLVGFKVKTALYDLKNYINERKKYSKNN